MYKTMRGHCYVGDKSEVGESATTEVAITVGVEKSSGDNKTKSWKYINIIYI